MSFRLEYKRGSTGPTMFQRYVRIQVDINPICKQGDVADLLFAITFTLLSGKLGIYTILPFSVGFFFYVDYN